MNTEIEVRILKSQLEYWAEHYLAEQEPFFIQAEDLRIELHSFGGYL